MPSQEKKPKENQPERLLKAYNNIEFLNSPAARTIRVLSEMIEPATRLKKHNVNDTVVFFGSARIFSASVAQRNLKEVEGRLHQHHKDKALAEKLKKEHEQSQRDLRMSRYYEDAVGLARKLTLWFNESKNKDKRFVICSGGGPGIMEAANRGATEAKGQSIGLNISLPLEQFPNTYQTREISFEFHYFFIRKFWFFYLAKALVIFPGGFGTLDEFFELLTLIQTQKSKKYMPVILFGSEYWNSVLNFDAMVKWGTISAEDLKLFRIFDDVDAAFQYLKKELEKRYFKQ